MAKKFLRTSPFFEGGSNNINKSGQIPRSPEREIWFLDDTTGEITGTTDLKLKLNKRNRTLKRFHMTYENMFNKREVSILLIVGSAVRYRSASQLQNTIIKRLSRLSIAVLGSYWQRDTGEIQFKEHYHLMIATKRLTFDELKSICDHKSIANIKIERCKSLQAFTNYLKRKAFYAPCGRRGFGCSKLFKINT